MRLTLRTMLAYLDDILEPADAQELEHKIEESKFASDLVHRIRSSTRRLRLGAPKVDGRGMAADPNSVAEYLDNVMPPEKVAEFEKVCLESDVHLAEVASAHQILTLVLGEPAAFSERVRERIYQLGHTGSLPPSSVEQGNGEGRGYVEEEEPSAPPVAAAVSPASVNRPSLVSQASGTASRAGIPVASLAITLLLGFVLALAALRAMGEFGPGHPLVRLLFGDPPPAEVVQAPTTPTDAKSETSTAPDPDSRSQSPVMAPDAAPSPASTTNPSPGDPGTQEAVPNAAVVNEAPGAVEPVTAAPAPDVRPVERPRPAEVPPMPEPPDPATVKVVPQKPAEPTIADPAKPAPASPATPATSGEAPAISAGRLLSEDQIIAATDRETGTWMVLPADASLGAGEAILSLPTYRPQILVAPNAKTTVSGDALLKLQAPDAGGVPRVSLAFGRLTLVPVGDMGNAMEMDVGLRRGILTFADVESAAAVEARPYLAPGVNPAETPPQLIFQVWATSGGLEWQEADRPAVKIQAGQRAAAIGAAPLAVEDAGVPPTWLDGRNLTDIDRRASQELRKFLTPDRPLSLSLMEQTTYRQVEVRSLACRSLCYVDIYEPALESFGDDQHRAYWHTHLDAIQARMAQGPEAVVKLRSALEKLYMDQGDVVFRLLYGYSPEQLAAGGAAELVDHLSSPSMTIRVLAYENLRRITGKTQLYRPEERPEQEKSKIAKWRKMLDDGQITYFSPPAIVPAGSGAEAGKR